MSPLAKTLIFTLCAVITMLVVLWSSTPAPESPSAAALSAPPAGTTPDTSSGVSVASIDSESGKYYFDVVDHSAEEFLALLKRAATIYDQTAPAQRAALEIVLVVHGPDIGFFARDNYARYREIVDTAASLDALGVFDFKVCTMTATRLGVAPEQVPDFLEFVPFGPGEVDRLEAAGYARL